MAEHYIFILGPVAWNLLSEMGPFITRSFAQNLEQIVHILARSWEEDSIKVQYYHNFVIDIFHPIEFDFGTLFYEVSEHENG